MIDIEKVITGLHCIADGSVRCESCGYTIDKHGNPSCQQQCAMDAILLLLEQKVVRCKDCTFLSKNKLGGYECSLHDNIFVDKDNWYCADGRGISCIKK